MSGRDIMSPDDVFAIFSNVEGICDFNSRLLKALVEGKKTKRLSEVVAVSFQQFGEYFRMYRYA